MFLLMILGFHHLACINLLQLGWASSFFVMTSPLYVSVFLGLSFLSCMLIDFSCLYLLVSVKLVAVQMPASVSGMAACERNRGR